MFELNLDISHFLDTCWQIKPTVIKQGFIGFEDPIMADEISTLAMEKEIESRLIYKESDKWQSQSGPFTSFEKLQRNGCSLLIQAVDQWHEEAQALVRPFRFLPNWRIDDLMASYSSKEGGVAAQINNQDLFIIQGSGKHHWRVGNKAVQHDNSTPSTRQHGKDFSAIIDVNLEPGDILYIPSGYPYEGYAVEPSLSYCINFRTPAQSELLSSFANYCLSHTDIAPSYRDHEMQIREKPGQIETQELNEIYKIMLSRCQTPEALIPWFGRMISKASHQLDVAKIEQPHPPGEILDLFAEGAQFTRLGGLRAVYFEEAPELLFINGREFNCEGFTKLSHYLADQDDIGSEVFELLKEEADALTLFTKLVNKGYWYAT